MLLLLFYQMLAMLLLLPLCHDTTGMLCYCYATPLLVCHLTTAILSQCYAMLLLLFYEKLTMLPLLLLLLCYVTTGMLCYCYAMLLLLLYCYCYMAHPNPTGPARTFSRTFQTKKVRDGYQPCRNSRRWYLKTPIDVCNAFNGPKTPETLQNIANIDENMPTYADHVRS